MKIDIYIGTEKLDYGDKINLVYSIGNIRDINIGSKNKSYTIDVPLTKNNQRILKYIDLLSSRDAITSTGLIFIDDAELLMGTVKILSVNNLSAKIIIDANDWCDTLENTKLKDVSGLSAKAVTLDPDVVSDSWTAADPFIRFGMIDFGQKYSTYNSYWITNDFIPAFSVVQLLTMIFSPLVIVSDWITDTYAKSLFFLGVEPRAESSFIQDKAMDAKPVSINENRQQWILPAHTRDFHEFEFDPVTFHNEIKDDGFDLSISGIYTVPETGTYRFTWSVDIQFAYTPVGGLDWSGGGMNRHCAIYKTGGTEIVSDQITDSIDISEINQLVTLDTGWVHLTAGTTVYCYYFLDIDVENTTALSKTFTMAVNPTSEFQNTWDNRNMYAGVGKSLDPVDYMPDKSCLDFLQGIKHFANLKFFIDRRNNKVYIEPSGTFNTDTVVDISDDIIDIDDLVSQPIASDYTKLLNFGLAEDKSDKAYNQYVTQHGIPYRKYITLSNPYTKKGSTDILNSFFATTILNAITGVPAIYGTEQYLSVYYDGQFPAYRPVGYGPRIFTWEGLTAFYGYYYNGASQATYPKLGIVDFADNYDTFYIKTVYYIDNCKVVNIHAMIGTNILMQFMGIINDSENEAFRPLYKIKVNNEYHYGLLQEITSNGDKCELILILM